MQRNRLWSLMGIALAVSAACAASNGPDPCPDLPPCVTGSTYNATACECVLDDEVPDAALDTSAQSPEDAGSAEASAEAD